MNLTNLRRSLCSGVVLALIATVGASVTAGSAGAVTAGGAVAPATAQDPRVPVSSLKVMNYFPAGTPWSTMWGSYDHAQIDADFGSIAAMGANAVRIIVQPGSVGYPTIFPLYAQRLQDVVDTATAHHLSVQLTLFDWWSSYDDIAGSTAWLRSTLAPLAGNTTIALVELQNEMDITKAGALPWAQNMLSILPSVLPGVPRTISISGPQDVAAMAALNIALPANLLDVVDVHLYRSVSLVANALLGASSIAGGRPIFAGEAGKSTAGSSKPCSDSAQARFYQELIPLASRFGVSSISPWIFSDFTAAGASVQSAQEASYGLRQVNGAWKPAANVVRSMFASASPRAMADVTNPTLLSSLDLDGDFACGDATLSPTNGSNTWTIFGRSFAQGGGVAPGAGENGSSAGFLSQTGGSSATWPSLMQELPVVGQLPLTVKANVRLSNATGDTRLGLAWFAGSTYLGGSTSSPASLTDINWQTLSVTGTPPAGATSFQIHLKSAWNSGAAYFDRVKLSPTVPNTWASFGESLATSMGTAAGAGRNGGGAEFLSGTGGTSSLWPSRMQTFPVTSSKVVTVGADVRLLGGTGDTRVGIAWYNGARYLGGAVSARASLSTSWQTLVASASPPAGATAFQIHLKSAWNSGTAYFDNVTMQQS